MPVLSYFHYQLFLELWTNNKHLKSNQIIIETNIAAVAKERPRTIDIPPSGRSVAAPEAAVEPVVGGAVPGEPPEAESGLVVGAAVPMDPVGMDPAGMDPTGMDPAGIAPIVGTVEVDETGATLGLSTVTPWSAQTPITERSSYPELLCIPPSTLVQSTEVTSVPLKTQELQSTPLNAPEQLADP